MAPAGGHKGSALALLVDLMAERRGSNFSFEASGFGGNDGGPPDVGQVVLAIDPTAVWGNTSSTASSTNFVRCRQSQVRAFRATAGSSTAGQPPRMVSSFPTTS